MEEYGDNWVIGASIVNHSINKRSQFNRGEKFSPYNFYYGKAPLDNRNNWEVGDIGAIRVPPNLLGSTDFPFIPVMVTKLHVSKKTGGIKYGLCTQHGYLYGYYYHQMISH